MTIGPVPQRPRSVASALTAAATAVPACSMSLPPGMPSDCARRSAPVIVSAEIAGSAARAAQCWRSARRSISKMAGSSAGSGGAASVDTDEVGRASLAKRSRRVGRASAADLRQSYDRTRMSSSRSSTKPSRSSPRAAARIASRSWTPSACGSGASLHRVTRSQRPRAGRATSGSSTEMGPEPTWARSRPRCHATRRRRPADTHRIEVLEACRYRPRGP